MGVNYHYQMVVKPKEKFEKPEMLKIKVKVKSAIYEEREMGDTMIEFYLINK